MHLADALVLYFSGIRYRAEISDSANLVEFSISENTASSSAIIAAFAMQSAII